MKKKNVTAILALLFGVYGVHRFYLGQRLRGFLHLLLGLFGAFIIIVDQMPFILLLSFLFAFIDAILFFVMPKEEFDEKHNYNIRASHNKQYQKDRNYIERPEAHYKMKGIESYKEFDFEAAISYFEQALDIKYDSQSVHFNLACCYSHLEMKEESFFHLEKAVDFGFNNFEWLRTNAGLSFIRTLDEFEDFVLNGYKMEQVLPLPHQASPGEAPHLKSKDLLEKIAMLGEFREKGILTEEEFQEQKQVILGTRSAI